MLRPATAGLPGGGASMIASLCPRKVTEPRVVLPSLLALFPALVIIADELQESANLKIELLRRLFRSAHAGRGYAWNRLRATLRSRRALVATCDPYRPACFEHRSLARRIQSAPCPRARKRASL